MYFQIRTTACLNGRKWLCAVLYSWNIGTGLDVHDGHCSASGPVHHDLSTSSAPATHCTTQAATFLSALSRSGGSSTPSADRRQPNPCRSPYTRSTAYAPRCMKLDWHDRPTSVSGCSSDKHSKLQGENTMYMYNHKALQTIPNSDMENWIWLKANRIVTSILVPK